jgi:hypothetical protein
MGQQIRIFISHDASDAHTAQDLQRQLALAVQPKEALFWDGAKVPTEAYRAQASAFLERADLFVALLSMRYADSPEVFWAAKQAVAAQADNPKLQIAHVLAKETPVPALLRAFISLLPAGETIENQGIARDRQLVRAAFAAFQLQHVAPRSNQLPGAKVTLPIALEDLRERLRAQTDRINHAPLLALLKRLIEDVPTKRRVLDIEEKFKQLRERTRLSQISIAELDAAAQPICDELYLLVDTLPEESLHAKWRDIFIRDYYRFVEDSRDDGTVPPFFVPTDDIIIPETLNLPVGPSAQESLEQIGLLSFEQKNEFRRSLLLAKDALAIKNYASAYAYCDHVRRNIDPQSAQLYEYLLITFLQKETAKRAMQETLRDNDRLLQHVLMFASRLREYLAKGQCPSTTARYNLAIASEGVSDAALEIYHLFPNDPILHTGKHAEAVSDNRRALRIILNNTLKVCRLVHPSEELLEAAVIECCGGGKCHWLRRVELVGDDFQFVPNGHFDLLGEIQELLAMLRDMESQDPNKIVKDPTLLREDLYFSLLAKKQAFLAQLAEDAKRRRPFTDVRASIVRFTHACLLGAHVFGDVEQRGRQHSFVRLALEFLLPDILLHQMPMPETLPRWFALNERGELVADPACAEYEFDVQGIVEKLIRDHASQAAWMITQTNLKQAVYARHMDDTERLYQSVKAELAHTDFRRIDDLDARGKLIECLRRWMAAYHAYPELGQHLPDRCIAELIGDGLLVWFQHSPDAPLVTHWDSIKLGYDALDALQALLRYSTRYTETDLRTRIAHNLFDKHLLPAYQGLKARDEAQRPEVVRRLWEAMAAYRLSPDPRYLELVFSELTEEHKFAWINIGANGQWLPHRPQPGFDPIAILLEINRLHPDLFRLLMARERIADRRHADQRERYFQEISEFRHENRRPERSIAIDIIRKMKGIYCSFPKDVFLELPLLELTGKGRIRWNAKFLGVFPIGENHYENHDYRFNYRLELHEVRGLLNRQLVMMQEVLGQTGDL